MNVAQGCIPAATKSSLDVPIVAGITVGTFKELFLCVHVFFYINSAVLNGKEISKFGISFNPGKRLREFNNGVRHRSNRGYCDPIIFSRRFTIRLSSRHEAETFERLIKQANKDKILSSFGLEVLDITLLKLVESFS